MLEDIRKLAFATQWELSRLVIEGTLSWDSRTLKAKMANGELVGGAVDVARSVADSVLGHTPRTPASVKEYEARVGSDIPVCDCESYANGRDFRRHHGASLTVSPQRST